MGRRVLSVQRLKTWDHLTAKQQAFVNHFMSNGHNATQAYRDAGYWCGESYGAIKVSAFRIRHHPNIDNAIKARMQELVMSETEALARQSDAARLDIGELLVSHPIVCPECGHEIAKEGEWRVDIGIAKQLGMTPLIKKISHDKQGRVQVEFRDPDAAQRTMLQTHGSLRGKKGDDGLAGLAALIKAAQASQHEREIGGDPKEIVIDE